MEETKISATVEKEGFTEEGMFFAYSEEEQQEQRENRANARLVFNPKFIPYYPDVVEKFSLTKTEALIYGFINFYTSIPGRADRFYFSNAQIAQVVNCAPKTASKSITILLKYGLIKVSRAFLKNGVERRYAQVNYADPRQNVEGGPPKRLGNNNSNNNTLLTNVSNENTHSLKTNKLSRATLDEGFAYFWGLYPRKRDKARARESFIKVVKTPEILESLKVGLEKWAREWGTWEEEECRYIPYPSTWLNGERWEDEVEKKRSQKVYI